MLTIKNENAKQNICRTCLIKMNVADCEMVSEENQLTVLEPESKDIWIKIAENGQLQALIDKYITEERFASHLEEYPQYMCFSCFNGIQQADKFLTQAKLSAEKLYNILDNRTDEEDAQAESNVTYKSLVRDSLMETETVLLETTLPPEVEVTNHADPFSIEYNSRKKDMWNSPESSEADNGWEASSIASTLSTNVKNTNFKPATRSSKRVEQKFLKEGNNRDKDVLVDYQTPSKKRKRRTKLEMAQLASEKIEENQNNGNKVKRRQRASKNNFKCTQCGHSFAHKITLDAHVRKIHEGSARPFHCDQCDRSYSFIGGLYTHIKEVHEKEERSHTCDFPGCGRTYTSFIAMQKHKRFKHTDEAEVKKYVCEQCGAAFTQSGNLRYHIRTKHPTEAEKAKKAQVQLFECEICKKMFHTCYTLKYHKMQLHSTEMKYECKICGVKKAKKFMLAQHMLIHSEDKMPCEQCGKRFIRKFELEAHVRTVHMKIKPFECKYCSEYFASRKTLRHHEYTHTGEKPYVCNICGLGFRQPTCLKTHQKTHEKIFNTISRNSNNTSLSESQQKAIEMLENVKVSGIA